MMKSTGIVRKVDELGRIVRPAFSAGSPGTWSRSRGATSAPSARKAWPNGMPTTEKSIAKEGEATLPPLFLVGGLDFGQPFRMITVL